MARRDTSPDFIEALARGLDVIRAFQPRQPVMSLATVAAPLRDGDGHVIASLNVNTHAAETPVELLTGEYLPLLLQTAGAISADWAACHAAPQVTVTPAALAGFRLPRVASP